MNQTLYKRKVGAGSCATDGSETIT